MTSKQPIRLVVNGARGRMGSRIAALARDDARFALIASLHRDSDAQAQSLAPRAFDALIDFSSDQGAHHAASLALQHQAALLVGTTGLSRKTLDFIGVAAQSTPVMIAPNTSRGVAVLNHLIAEAARLLGPEYDVDLIEAHHTMKRDAPSGTALRLVQTLRDRAGVTLPAERVHCIRAGEIVGEHTVQFAGPGEILKISHAATNRDLFARGALQAILWLCQQKPGLYTIEQSLGLG